MRMFRILILVLFLSGLIHTPVVLSMGNVNFDQDSPVSKKAADFTLNTIQGSAVTFSQYRGNQKAVIFFWATWCPHCLVELRRLHTLKDEITAQGIKLVLISVGEPAGVVRDYIAKNQYTFDVLLDENQVLEADYQIIGVPTLFYVDEGGIIRWSGHAFPENYQEVFK